MRARIFRAVLGTAAVTACILTAAAIGIAMTDGIVRILLSAAAFLAVIAGAWLAAAKISAATAAPLERLASGDETDIPAELAPIAERLRSQQQEFSRRLAGAENDNNRLLSVINSMDEGLIILDTDMRVIMLNESAHRMLEAPVPREECPGSPFGTLCAAADVCAAMERAESANLTVDGRNLQLHVSHGVPGDEQIGRIALLLDVTERTEIERIKQEFTANVSHELKTPLTSISGYAELIESGMAQNADAQLFAGRIRRESTRMLALISDIIKLSKLDEAADDVELEPCELYQICAGCMDLLEMSAKRHEVSLSLEGGKCVIPGSPSQLSELVYNLIDNGIRYNRPGGRVRVQLEASPAAHPGALAMLSVSDTGIGISKEHQARVFERFYRVDKSRSKETGGTGLGLAIVKHVAELHHARILLDSRLGEGTTIRVVFFGYLPENL